MRYYVARKGVHPFTRIVDLWYEKEQEYHDIEVLNEFSRNIILLYVDFYMELFRLKQEENNIVGVSAPAKGNTLLNYFGIDSSILDYITEKSERKIGKFTPGTHIEVVPDARLIEDQPDYAIILAWNWTNQIKDSLKGYKGEWIDAKGFKDIRGRSFGTCGECDCSGTPKEGIHECCGVSCGTDKQVSDVHPI